ncbi:MAG TPA: protein translocase subunit SecD [Gammaproteobacteria bacterium]|nr:protein translocase subunit SecD [Gammaproteobacteria bacterium]
MNRYPLWKNLLVAGIVLVSMIVALPNVFGTDVALNITRGDGEPMDQAALTQVSAVLADKNVAFKAVALEGKAVLVRFVGAEDQLRANDILRAALPNNVVALNIVSRTPSWLLAVGLKPMSLGLDLRGGVHFLFQVTLKDAIDQYLRTFETDLRTQLRTANIRNDVRVAEGALEVSILDSKDLVKAEEIVRKLDSGDQVLRLGQLTSRLIVDPTTVDDKPGFKVSLTETAIKERQDAAIQQNTLTLRNRVNALGVAEAVVQRQGLDRILVELPGMQDPGEAQRVLGSTATLEFHMVDQDNDPFEAQRRGRPPLGSTLEHKTDKSPILLRRDIIASGDQLVDATFQPTTQQGTPGVSIRLDATAARKMLDTTIANVGRKMAVLYIEYKPQVVEKDGKLVPGPPLREQRVINDATINGVFSNRFEITGLSAFEGRDLALLLRSGSLAAPISVVEQRTIGPSLGQDNIDRGIRATIVGYLLVVLFIGFYYRMFGVLADLALAANLVMLIALMSRFGFQLSLPGIAGIVLTVGMAVDANVLIFERIREELNNGNSPQASIRAGFDKAYTTIVDSNLTTLIAAVVLFMFGSGPVKGFAVTLSIGILTSMFTAVTVTRCFVNLVYGSRQHLKSLPIGGTKPVAGKAAAASR